MMMQNAFLKIFIFSKTIVIVCNSEGSGLLASVKYLREQAIGVFPTVSRDYKVTDCFEVVQRANNTKFFISIFHLKYFLPLI